MITEIKNAINIIITKNNIIYFLLVLLTISFLQFVYTQYKNYSANKKYYQLSDAHKKILNNIVSSYLKGKKISMEDINNVAIDLVYYNDITNNNIQKKIETDKFLKYINELI